MVRAGDSLSKIAARHRLPGGWQALYALNRSVVGKNPNVLQVGEHLRLR
jgi:LysM repeat protein